MLQELLFVDTFQNNYFVFNGDVLNTLILYGNKYDYHLINTSQAIMCED